MRSDQDTPSKWHAERTALASGLRPVPAMPCTNPYKPQVSGGDARVVQSAGGKRTGHGRCAASWLGRECRRHWRRGRRASLMSASGTAPRLLPTHLWRPHRRRPWPAEPGTHTLHSLGLSLQNCTFTSTTVLFLLAHLPSIVATVMLGLGMHNRLIPTPIWWPQEMEWLYAYNLIFILRANTYPLNPTWKDKGLTSGAM